ncbi:MAG TPA: acyl-ACP--UDP-N-acetylglucosamine O-acyltransferase [Stellaceae bacterium]|nr:acyl-ACP--UDP-N-acetylglucosamine O-acyltransferase [Stellaceae bacterium]
MTKIHETAIVDPAARIASDVVIGPYCLVGPDVELGSRVELISHVVVAGRTTIGEATRIFPFASIGHQPQDLKYQGEPSTLKIGAHNTIREYVTMNPGTTGGGMKTVIGDHCLFMASSHVAHDCTVGDHVILANQSTLAGHVTVGDFAFFGGICAVHQFVRIGQQAMIGGMTGVENDVIPYGLVMGDRARLSGLNLRGLQRRGFGKDAIQSLRSAYRMLFAQEGTLAERLDDVARHFQGVGPVMEIVAFIRADSSRAICQPKPTNGA